MRKMPARFLTLSILLLSIATFAAAREPVDMGKTVGNVFESSFFYFSFEFPQSWTVLDDKVRLAENEKRYKGALPAESKQDGTATAQDQGATADTVVPYFLLLASKVPVASENEKPLPRISIIATRREPARSQPGDPAKMYAMVANPKVLKQSEDVVISGHKFVRTDFRLKEGSFLSKFTTARGNYLIDFDLLANNEKDLADLVKTMQSIRFTDN
jgi:hypothetical protein